MMIGYNIARSQTKGRIVDSTTVKTWPEITDQGITNDGRYCMYTIRNVPVGSQTIVVKQTSGSWERHFPGMRRGHFLNDGKKAVINNGDSILILSLGTSESEIITNVRTYSVDVESKSKWLAYQPKGKTSELVVRSLESGLTIRYLNVQYFKFSDSFKRLILRIRKDSQVNLAILDLASLKLQTIWTGKSIENFIANDEGTRLAFVSTANSCNLSIWIYNNTDDGAKMVDLPRNIDFHLKELSRFSADSKFIFLRLKKVLPTKRQNSDVAVNIWNYKDSVLMSEQNQNLNLKDRSYLFSYSIETGKLLRLEQDDDNVNVPFYSKYSDTWFSGGSRLLTPGTLERIDHFIVNTSTGKKIKVETDATISPHGKFAVYFNPAEQLYHCLDLKSGKEKEISKELTKIWDKSANNDADSFLPVLRGVAGWTSDERYVFIYDEFDIFRFDLQGIENPLNVTGGYGRRNKIVFNFLPTENDLWIGKTNESAVLIAFNKNNKQNGFFRIKLNSESLLAKLFQGNYLFWNPTALIGVSQGSVPIKARFSETYLITRMSATTSANLFVTTDLKTFKQITDIKPELPYNWLTSELHSWQTPKGIGLNGVLYKPKDFDPNKKYPIIFYYYRKLSDGLNASVRPEFSDGRLNIASYVSDGYLVFTPDIYFTIGETGQSALEAVVSAATYLSELPYVNNKKMGIQGVSFGGLQTNYILTHTNLFAAACSASGHYDLVSGYGGTYLDGQSKQGMFEKGPYQIGTNLWDNPKLYLRNSPILYADKVSTPFLMMHTTHDTTIPIAEAVEFFTALRRLGKRVWMLEYDKWDHGLSEKEAEDFTLRMKQFFDYYLKDKHPPRWMTKGLPSTSKGMDDGLQLDYSGVNP